MNEEELENSQPQVLRRSIRERRSAIAYYYNDSTSLNETKLGVHSSM